jgi:protein TonB
VSILAFRYFPEISVEKTRFVDNQPLIELTDIPETGKPEIPPPPMPSVMINEELVDDEIPDIDIETTELDENDKVEDDPLIFDDDSETPDFPFDFVEDMPEIIGGLAALQKNVIYPEIAVRAGVEGKVRVEAIINKFGEVENAKIVKGIGAGCDEAAIEAVMKTKFKPGKQRGKAVKVRLSIPISFVINKN